MNKCEESLAVQNDLDEMQTLVNPSLSYEVLIQYYFSSLKTFWMFENSN